MNNDALFLQAFRSGDEAAFATLTEKYRHAIQAACERQAPYGEVDDCVQAVFLVLARRPAAALRAPVLVAWLHRVAHYVCRDARRAAIRRRQIVNTATQPNITGHPPEAAVLEQLDSALLRLAERQRAAVLLHASGSANDDIAKSLGVTTANASKLVQRGLTALRDQLCRSGAPIGAAALLTLITTKQATAAGAVPLTFNALINTSISANATLLAKGTLMHLTMTATSTWLIAASLFATICVGGVVASEAITLSQPPTLVAADQTPTPAPVVNNWEQALAEKLNKNITFDFEKTAPAEALSFLAKLINLNIIIHPKADAIMQLTPITLTVKDITAREALTKITTMCHVRYVVVDQAIFITRLAKDDNGLFEETEKLLTEAEVVGTADQTLWGKAILAQLDQEVDLDFQDIDSVDAVYLIQKFSGAHLVLDTKVIAGDNPQSVTMKVEAMKLRYVLNHLMRLTNLRYQLRNYAHTFITTRDIPKQAQAPKPKPANNETYVNLKLHHMRASIVTKWISHQTKTTIRLDPRIEDKDINFSVEEESLADTLQLLAPLLGAEVKRFEEDGGGYLLVPKNSAIDQEPPLPAAAQ